MIQVDEPIFLDGLKPPTGFSTETFFLVKNQNPKKLYLLYIYKIHPKSNETIILLIQRDSFFFPERLGFENRLDPKRQDLEGLLEIISKKKHVFVEAEIEKVVGH